jgi:Fe-S-cluster containining protein
VSPEEIRRIAEFRGEEPEEFSKQFVRRVRGRYSLIEKPGGDCIFWDKEAGCTVYPARPTQCRTWPFWPENVETPEDWKHVCQVCPGSGQGRLYTVEEIGSALAMVKK